MSKANQQSEDRAEALAKKVADQEQLILMLQKQQRDVRFLSKSLYRETQLRLNKRAKIDNTTKDYLVYAHSEDIKEKIKNPLGSRQDSLDFIHKQDSLNIGREHHNNLSKKAKSVGWKIIAKTFHFSAGVSKKVARRVL